MKFAHPFVSHYASRTETPQPFNGVLAFLARALDRFLLYRNRAVGRRLLAAMDDRMLRDIGLSRGNAQMEADKPFWKE
ncbi:MAG: DUF1127 domain-containing protein [Alphaproteobacteria bacterium]|nr:DUF1127 domain-containing protein [Alphaproteobacteria bacterium]